MKKNLPMNGAVSIVGKDSLGRKFILPTTSHKIRKTNNEKKPSWIKRIVSVFHRRELLGDDMVRVKINVSDCNQICADYSTEIHDRWIVAMDKWKQNKREKLFGIPTTY